MLESPAYRVLSLSARRIIDRLEIELAHHGGKDNGKLPTTFDDFEAYGIHRHAIAPAIREVEALGFISITERGRAGNADWRRPHVYRLTFRHTERDDPTHDWKRIATTEIAETIAGKARGQRRKSSGGNRTAPVVAETAPLIGTEIATTGHSAETTTTLDISGHTPSAPGGLPPPRIRAHRSPRGTQSLLAMYGRQLATACPDLKRLRRDVARLQALASGQHQERASAMLREIDARLAP
jgi:hypothetical protein